MKDDSCFVLSWKTQQWPQDWKRSVLIPIPKKGNARECSNYCTIALISDVSKAIALISHASKVMLKVLQARLQQYVNHELPDVQVGFRKGRGTRDHICQHLLDHRKSKSKRVPEKKSTSALLTMPKPLIVWVKTNSGKFFKRWEYQTTLPASWEICMLVKKWQLELDMEQQTGSKLGKGYIKAVYCHSAYLTYKQWVRAFIGSWGGQHPETAQSSSNWSSVVCLASSWLFQDS